MLWKLGENVVEVGEKRVLKEENQSGTLSSILSSTNKSAENDQMRFFGMIYIFSKA